jgi:hypothetical protein
VRAWELDAGRVPSAFADDMDAGQELDKIAKRNQELDPSLNYGRAFRLACLENPKLAEKYTGRAVRADQVREVQKHFETASQVRKYDQTADSRICSVISGTPKLSDHTPDINTILQACNGYGEGVLAQAAAERLDVLVRDEINLTGTPGSEVSASGGMESIRRRVESRFKELKLVADGGTLSERGLRQLAPQLLGQR